MAVRSKKKQFPAIAIVLILLVAAVAVFGWLNGYFDGVFDKNIRDTDTEASVVTPPVSGGLMELHVIDIGQGDSLLVKTTEGFILIDTGDRSSKYEEALRAYLNGEGVETLEYVIFTHMDADHIGNAAMVLEEYEVKNVIMSDLDESDIPTTNVYEKMEDKIVDLQDAGKIEVILAEPGTVYTLGDMKMTVLGPLGDDYPSGDRNNYSVCVRLDYGETSFLLTGDAEERAELEMLAQYKNGELDCDFFKAGHHGANTSNTSAFLKAVTPKYVAISCGADNKYLHPHPEALERFEKIGATVWRTDLDGDLVFVSDGKTIVKE